MQRKQPRASCRHTKTFIQTQVMMDGRKIRRTLCAICSKPLTRWEDVE